jgi:diguanylate cyclase (GGDEF)-like protein
VKERRQLESFDSRQLESLRVFHEVASALTSNLDLESLLRTIMRQMEEFFEPEQWSLLMVDQEHQELHFALSEGIEEEVLRNVRLPLGEGIAGHVAASGDPLVVPDVRLDPDWSQYAASHPQKNLQSIACLPIRHGDRTLAVLQLHNSKLDRLPDSSISFLRVLCDYAAIALENARNVKLIHDLSITDDCTGLFNARCLYDMLEQEIAEYQAKVSNPRVVSIQPPHFSLLFLDLDHFKSINDTHGHQTGSRLLAEVGGVIKRVLGPEHSAFRYGGDEFVALLRGLDTPEATLLAEELRSELNENSFLSAMDMTIHVTGSFGLATFPKCGDSLHAIIRCADAMMYKAKAEGRNRLAVADPQTPPTMPVIKTSRHG